MDRISIYTFCGGACFYVTFLDNSQETNVVLITFQLHYSCLREPCGSQVFCNGIYSWTNKWNYKSYFLECIMLKPQWKSNRDTFIVAVVLVVFFFVRSSNPYINTRFISRFRLLSLLIDCFLHIYWQCFNQITFFWFPNHSQRYARIFSDFFSEFLIL